VGCYKYRNKGTNFFFKVPNGFEYFSKEILRILCVLACTAGAGVEIARLSSPCVARIKTVSDRV
jgi:hypothetical protein